MPGAGLCLKQFLALGTFEQLETGRVCNTRKKGCTLSTVAPATTVAR